MNVIKNTAIAIFLLVAGIYAMTLNSWNAKYFGLQAATVAGLAEHGTFRLMDQVIPGFNLVEGDETFRYGKQVYPMKQPGQTVLGAMIYYPLYKLNFTFVNHYDYVVHLITFLTSSLMMAASATILFLLAYQISRKLVPAVVTAGVFAFATIIWPYAGVMHHDIYATFFAILGVAAYFYYVYTNKKPSMLVLAGMAMGIMLFFSMLPVTLPIGLGIIVLLRKNVRELGLYVSGLLVGLFPSFIFNYSLFGSILAFPNIAGRVADTVPFWSLPNLIEHLKFYLLSPYSLFVFSPVLLFSTVGIALIPKKYQELKKLLVLLPLLQLLHISTQATYGGFQYGPRYLLTILPFITVGTVFVWEELKKPWRKVMFLVTLVYSFMVSAIGALQTVMYPVPGEFGPWASLLNVINGNMPELRMLPVGIGLVILSLIVLAPRRLRTYSSS